MSAPPAAATGRRLGTASAVLVLVGATLVVLARAGLVWYRVEGAADSAGTGFTFADLRDNADRLNTPVSAWYFDWLSVTLLCVATGAGLAATVRTRVTDLMRVAGFLAGVAGVIVTYYALAQLFNAQRAAGGSDHTVWHNSTFGVWASMIGFLLVATGAARGVR